MDILKKKKSSFSEIYIIFQFQLSSQKEKHCLTKERVSLDTPPLLGNV